MDEDEKWESEAEEDFDLEDFATRRELREEIAHIRDEILEEDYDPDEATEEERDEMENMEGDLAEAVHEAGFDWDADPDALDDLLEGDEFEDL